MKKINIILIASGMILSALFSSCTDFLTQEPQTALSTEQIFADIENIQPFLDGIYYKWRDTRVNRKGFFLILGTDEVQQGDYQVRSDAAQGGLDKYDGFYEAANTSIAEIWNVRWPVVVLASEALESLRDLEQNVSKEDSARVQSFIGQASFYRACVLFELAQYWGELPIPEVSGKKITLSGRKPLAEVYEMIETDLLKAEKCLSEKASANIRVSRTWAVKAMLAKMYMSAQTSSGYRDYGKAQTLLEEIKTKGGYSLLPNYADLWDGEKNADKESLYTFYFNNVWPDTNELQWYAGSRAVSSDPNCYMGGYDLGLPTAYCHGTIWETGDLRREESIRYNFIYNGKAPVAVAGFGDDQTDPHIKKFEDKRTDGVRSFYNSGKNMYFIRYSDVLLMLAECMNEEGDTPGAVAIVNDVRARAWGGTLPEAQKWNTAMSPDDFRKNIMDERMRELCFEGWRRSDLIRTGKFVENISRYNQWAKASGTIKKEHERFPIPLVELKQNPNITEADQNPGY